jgi:23S rRNA pseudouridine1911/1915/1917 synthase
MNTAPDILFEDEHILVLNKPAGLMVHADAKNEGPTLVDWLLEHHPPIQAVGEEGRWGLVHRLDRETSGVMVVAKTLLAHARLKKQFANREVRKVYRTFVYGTTPERGIIERPIGSSRGMGPRSAKQAYGKMREAITAYRTIINARIPAAVSYVEVFPKTGRTHQVRVHFASLGHPVVGDTLYAKARGSALGFERLALHALSLSFTHPGSGQEVTYEAPLPQDFIAAAKQLRAA